MILTIIALVAVAICVGYAVYCWVQCAKHGIQGKKLRQAKSHGQAADSYSQASEWSLRAALCFQGAVIIAFVMRLVTQEG